MPGRSFLDTNILVYAFSSEGNKKDIAEELLINGGTVGVQTLNEFVSVVGGKSRTPWPIIIQWLEAIRNLCAPPVPLTLSVHMRGIRISEIYGYHIYDSLMVAAALEASCTIFYTEDLHHNQQIADLTIRNPFA